MIIATHKMFIFKFSRRVEISKTQKYIFLVTTTKKISSCWP